jgi:hypothetical protein
LNLSAIAALGWLGFTVLVGLLSVSTASSAKADEIVAFYFHSFGVSPRGAVYFPHTFVTIAPAPGPEGSLESINETAYPSRSFGFVSAKPGPILLLHHTRGEVIDSAKGYLSVSRREFAVRVSDAQYQSLLDAVAAWRAVNGDPYDLRHRNCVTFVAALARALGMDVGDDRTLDPLRFLIDLRRRNMDMISPDDAPFALPTRVAAAADAEGSPRPEARPIPGDVPSTPVAGPLPDERP